MLGPAPFYLKKTSHTCHVCEKLGTAKAASADSNTSAGAVLDTGSGAQQDEKLSPRCDEHKMDFYGKFTEMICVYHVFVWGTLDFVILRRSCGFWRKAKQ